MSTVDASEESYVVVTPYGLLRAFFPEDGSPVRWEGDETPLSYFQSVLLDVVGPNGYSVSAQSLSEHVLMHYCTPKGSGIEVLPPWSAIDPRIAAVQTENVLPDFLTLPTSVNTESTNGNTTLDSATQAPTAIEKLRYLMANRQARAK